MKRWTSEEEEILIYNYKKIPIKELVSKLKRNTDSIYGKAKSLGLTKGGPGDHSPKHPWRIHKAT